MKKFLLSMALVLCTIGAMAQTKSIEFKVAPTGTGLTDIPVTVTVDGVATDKITATLSASANGVTALKNISNVVCFDGGSGNSNAATVDNPQIYTLTINGLEGTLSNISISNKALTGGGDWQGEYVTRRRHYNVSYGKDANNLTFVEDRIDLISITGTNGSVERAKDFAVADAKTSNPFVVQLKLYNVTDAEKVEDNDAQGCYFGLTGFTLTVAEEEVVEPEPTPELGIFHPSNRNITAEELMGKTEPTYIAIKGLANKNNEYWNYVSGEANTSTQYFKQNAIFVWEPVIEGKSGSYYLKKIGNGYMQSSNPGTYAETTADAAVFTAVKPIEVASGANSELQFNRDANSTELIANAGGADNIVRFVTGGKWLNIGDRLTSAQAPAFNNGYGAFTIYQICVLEEFEETLSITIKNTGDEDYATFYSNAPTQMPEGVTAYTITEDGIANGYISLNKIENGATIPANTGVILKTAVEADEEIAITVAEENVAPLATNLLQGSVENENITEEAYVLGNEDGVGLYKAKMSGGVWLNNANKAYLPASALPAAAQASNGFRFGEGTTGVENVTTENGNVKTIFDLTGRRVEDITTPGIYIVNGKKVLVK